VSLARRSNVHNVQLRWEYSSATGWDQLEVSDGTKAFSENGVLEFIGPALWATAETLGHPHYWLRCRSMLDDVHPNAVLKGVFPNAVEVVQARSFRGEALGSSTARPLQSFQLIWTPVLPGSEVLVREKTSYDTRELDNLRARLGHDAVVDDGRGGFWILWREVESFYHSGPNDRHYTLDPIDGVVTFGDGKRGMIPPRGDDNVKANVYQQTAGARGNVAARTIAVLESAAPGVDKVANPEPAGGGADAESIEDAKLRAPSEFKARYRAVTTEDFECLAQQASGQVAKAHATRADGDGADEVVVVIVPREAPGDPNTSLGKLRPDGRLIRQVRDYLDVHRLITSRLRVRGPDYQDIRLSLTVHPTPEYMERFSELKILIAQRLRAFIHPLRGPNRGSDGDGWPMGRTLHKSELYYVVEAIPGVDYVDNLLMWKWAEDLSYDANMRRVGTEAEDNIYIEPWAFHYFRELEISRV
jgi:predicted phage baseplate assembly protein